LGKYDDASLFITDMRLIFANARQYNDAATENHRDATTLSLYFDNILTQRLSSPGLFLPPLAAPSRPLPKAKAKPTAALTSMTVSMSGDSITSCTPVLARVTNTAFKKSSVASVPLAVIMGKQTLNAEIADDMVDDDMVDDDMVDVSASRAHCTEMRSKDAEKNLCKKIAAGDDSDIVTSLMRADGLTVCPGDYVLVRKSSKNSQASPPSVVLVTNLWTKPGGVLWFNGIWFYYPDETFHKATRMFIANEVLRSNEIYSHPLSDIVRKCHVAHIKDFLRELPEGIPETDVFVCEFKYTAKGKSFQKIKVWGKTLKDIPMVARARPLEAHSLPRIPSVFAAAAAMAAAASKEEAAEREQLRHHESTKVIDVMMQQLKKRKISNSILGRPTSELGPPLKENKKTARLATFEVEKIIDIRDDADYPGEGLKEYLTKWKGYPESDATWEPSHHLINSTDIMEKFLNQRLESLAPN